MATHKGSETHRSRSSRQARAASFASTVARATCASARSGRSRAFGSRAKSNSGVAAAAVIARASAMASCACASAISPSSTCVFVDEPPRRRADRAVNAEVAAPFPSTGAARTADAEPPRVGGGGRGSGAAGCEGERASASGVDIKRSADQKVWHDFCATQWCEAAVSAVCPRAISCDVGMAQIKNRHFCLPFFKFFFKKAGIVALLGVFRKVVL